VVFTAAVAVAIVDVSAAVVVVIATVVNVVWWLCYYLWQFSVRFGDLCLS